MRKFFRPICYNIANSLYGLSNAIGRVAMWFDTCTMRYPEAYSFTQTWEHD